MTLTLKDVIQRRLEASNFPAALPSPEEFSKVQNAELESKLPPLNDTIVKALASATRALQSSNVGKELAERALDMKPQEVLELANEVARIPEIRQVVALARQSDVFASETLGDGTDIKDILSEYLPQSLIVNFAGMFDVVAGLTLNIGFAIDLADFRQDELENVAIFIGGAIGVGGEAIVAIGQGVGLSANAYSDMTGICAGVNIGGAFGAGVLLDGSVGVSAPFVPVPSHMELSQWTVILYVLQGIGAGVSIYGGFFLQIINRAMPDIEQPPAAHSTTISSITCHNTQDSTGSDELYFQVTIDDQNQKVYRYPLWDYFSIDENSSWNVGFTINFNSKFELTLLNNETSGENTIHTFSVASDGIPSGGSSTTLVYDNESGGAFHNHVHYEVKLYTPRPV